MYKHTCLPVDVCDSATVSVREPVGSPEWKKNFVVHYNSILQLLTC
jgi:hypothetical protein